MNQPSAYTAVVPEVQTPHGLNQSANRICTFRDRGDLCRLLLRQDPTWGQKTEWDAKTRLVTLFHRAVDQELIPGNFIRRIRKPPVKSRGREALITPEDHAR